MFNRIPSVDIGEDQFVKRPRFSIDVLAHPQHMQQFKEVVNWMIEQINA